MLFSTDQASSLGNLEFIQVLIEKGALINVQDKYGLTPLHLACFNGHKNVVDYLLNPNLFNESNEKKRDENGNEIIGASVNINDYDNRSVLHAAVWRACNDDYLSIIDSLLEHKANINQPDKNGRTPVFWNVIKGNCNNNIIEHLVSHNADVNVIDHFGRNLIHYAAYQNCGQALSLLIHHYGVYADLKDYEGNTPLHACIRWDEAVELLSTNVDTLITNNMNRTPIHIAMLSGYSDNFLWLLQGAEDFSVNSPDSLGRTVFHMCALSNAIDCIDLLINVGGNIFALDKYKQNILHLAAKCGNNRFMEVLLKYVGKDKIKILINSKDINGRKPIHIAAATGNDKTCKFLLEQHDVENDNLFDNSGYTPLHFAAYFSNLDCLTILNDQCPTFINTVDKIGAKAIHFAAMGDSLHAFEILRTLGDHLHDTDLQGRSVLFYAKSEEFIEYLISNLKFDLNSKDLLERNVLFSSIQLFHNQLFHILHTKFELSLSIKDKNQVNLIHQAVSSNNQEILEFLLENSGLNALEVDAKGRNALHYACFFGFIDILKILLSKFPNSFDSRDNLGRSPLDTAAYSNHLDVVALLLDVYSKNKVKEIKPANDGRNPLHSCIYRFPDEQEDKSVILELLKYFSINSKDKSGKTVLHRAVYLRKYKTLEFLLKNKADPNILDNTSISPFHLAASLKNNRKLISIFNTHCKIISPSLPKATSLPFLPDYIPSSPSSSPSVSHASSLPPDDLQKVLQENKILKETLSTKNSKINQLTENNDVLQEELKFYKEKFNSLHDQLHILKKEQEMLVAEHEKNMETVKLTHSEELYKLSNANVDLKRRLFHNMALAQKLCYQKTDPEFSFTQSIDSLYDEINELPLIEWNSFIQRKLRALERNGVITEINK